MSQLRTVSAKKLQARLPWQEYKEAYVFRNLFPKEVLNYKNDIVINEKNIKIVPVASQNHSKEATNDILAVGTLKDIHIDHNDDEMVLSVLLKKYFVEEKSIVLKFHNVHEIKCELMPQSKSKFFKFFVQLGL